MWPRQQQMAPHAYFSALAQSAARLMRRHGTTANARKSLPESSYQPGEGVRLRQVTLLTFFERIIRDVEFREWFVTQPDEALASHNLDGRSLQELYAVLEWGGPYRQTAAALKPLVDYLVECWRDGEQTQEDLARERYDRLTSEIERLKGRMELSEAYLGHSRPWWKFWEWKFWEW